ncbi:hypothetical protein T492DRAFT_1043164 [Pavlovales sp. CCMP2436]|nr:hypothetical protein T492DRAFT_1043164 [Pavlovales sp. CCMP2436]
MLSRLFGRNNGETPPAQERDAPIDPSAAELEATAIALSGVSLHQTRGRVSFDERPPLTLEVEPSKGLTAKGRSRRRYALCACILTVMAIVVAVVAVTAEHALSGSLVRTELPASSSGEQPRGAVGGTSSGSSMPRPLPVPPPSKPPPSPPAASAVFARFTVAGDSAAGFDSRGFREGLASALGIPPSRVQIDRILAGSLVIEVQIRPPASAEEESSQSVRGALLALSLAELQAKLPNFVIESKEVADPRSPSPPPSPPPPSPPPSPPPPKRIFPDLPKLPDLPHLPNISLPELPKLPDLPHLPNISLPELPKLPDLPHSPNISLPEVPKLPDLPHLPNISLPELPKLPDHPHLPNISLPDLPDLPDWLRPNSTIPSVPGWPDWPWPWGNGSWLQLPFIPKVPDGVQTPPNLVVDAAIQALWDDWLGLWWNRNRTRFPDGEQAQREPFEACTLSAAGDSEQRAARLLVAMRDALRSHEFPAGTSSAWVDAARVLMGEQDPSKLFHDELNRTAALLAGRSAEAIDSLSVAALLLLTAADSPALGAELVAALREGALGYSYWLDEFGGPAQVESCAGRTAAERKALLDSGNLEELTYWPDDESIVLHTAQHLLGHALAESQFAASCRTGAEQRALGEERILRWLSLRLSPGLGLTVMDDDVAIGRVVGALSVLSALSPSADVQLRAKMAIDVVLTEIAVHAFQGTLPMSRGQNSAGLGGFALSSNLVWLISGRGTCLLGESATAALAVSKLRSGYVPPGVLAAISNVLEPGDNLDEVVKTHNGIDATPEAVEDAGLSYGGNATVRDCEYWLSATSAATPETVECPFILGRAYGSSRGPLRKYRYLQPLSGIVLDLPPLKAWLGSGGDDATEADAPKTTLLAGAVRMISPAARGAATFGIDTYDYRLQGVTLTSLLDYNKGALNVANRHPLTASLAPAKGAVVFTSQPARPAFQASAHEWWSVQATMPRVAQFHEMAITIYNPPLEVSALLPLITGAVPPQLTHAYFNKSAFDEYTRVVGRDDVSTWHCGRMGDGYVAIYSYQPAAFAAEGPYAGVDLLADGYRNVWITHVGSRSRDGDFDKWVNSVRMAKININILPPGADRDGGLPFCLWQNQCIVGFPDQIDYWRLVKCVQWIPFVNSSPPCGKTLNTMGFVGCYLGCKLPDWRLCLAMCAVKSIDWSLPSATFGHVDVEYIPWFKPAMEFSWDDELLVGRRYNAVRREPYDQTCDRFDTPFGRADRGIDVRKLAIRAKNTSLDLDFGESPRRTVVNAS